MILNIAQSEYGLKLHEFLDEAGNWDLMRFKTFIPAEWRKIILDSNIGGRFADLERNGKRFIYLSQFLSSFTSYVL